MRNPMMRYSTCLKYGRVPRCDLITGNATYSHMRAPRWGTDLKNGRLSRCKLIWIVLTCLTTMIHPRWGFYLKTVKIPRCNLIWIVTHDHDMNMRNPRWSTCLENVKLPRCNLMYIWHDQPAWETPDEVQYLSEIRQGTKMQSRDEDCTLAASNPLMRYLSEKR